MHLLSLNFRFQPYFCEAICPPSFRVKLEKSRQLFIGVRNETLSIVAVCVCNPDCLSVAIYRRDRVSNRCSSDHGSGVGGGEVTTGDSSGVGTDSSSIGGGEVTAGEFARAAGGGERCH